MRVALMMVALSALVACQTTGTPTGVRPGYEAGGMCNGGAHCGRDGGR